MLCPHSLIRGTVPILFVLTFSVSTKAQVKRYALLGDDSQAEAALESLGKKKIKSFKNFEGLAVNLSDSEADMLRARLGGDLRLINDEPFKAFDDVEVTKGRPAGGGGQPSGGGQQIPWGITAVSAPSAWSITKGVGTAVCVVDTGIDDDHPDLAAIGAGENYINGGSWNDDNGHGTHVGGTIAALDNSTGVVGVAPDVTLLAAKALDRRGRGTNTDIADAILGCPLLRDQVNPTWPLVVNMSFVSGGSDREIIHDAIKLVQADGALFVGAAGNHGEYAPNHLATPARWDEVLAITGVDQEFNFATFSGAGGGPQNHRDPDFAAPAVEVLSLWKGGKTKTLDGTSMSAAHASGVVALGLSAGSLGPLGTDLGLPINQQGQGLIDALLTVQNQPSSSALIVLPEPSSSTLLLSVIVLLPLIRLRRYGLNGSFGNLKHAVAQVWETRRLRRIAMGLLLLTPSGTYAGSLGTLVPWISKATPQADLAMNNDDYVGDFDANVNRLNVNEEGPCCPGADVRQSIVSTERIIPIFDSGGITEYALALGGEYDPDDTLPGVTLDSLFQVQLGFGTGDNFVRASKVTAELKFDTPSNVSPAIEDRFSLFPGDIPLLKLLEHQGDRLIYQGSSTTGQFAINDFSAPELFHLPLDIPDLPLSVRDFYSPAELGGIGTMERAFTIRISPVPEPSTILLGLLGLGSIVICWRHRDAWASKCGVRGPRGCEPKFATIC